MIMLVIVMIMVMMIVIVVMIVIMRVMVVMIVVMVMPVIMMVIMVMVMMMVMMVVIIKIIQIKIHNRFVLSRFMRPFEQNMPQIRMKPEVIRKHKLLLGILNRKLLPHLLHPLNQHTRKQKVRNNNDSPCA